MNAAGYPLLERGLEGEPFIYLDSASTTPKPRAVISAVTNYYETLGANVHRGLHPLAEASTEAFERARHKVAAFIGALPSEIIFTRNATESFNLLAQAMRFSPGDEVIFPASEHHSNYLPWRVHATGSLVDIDDEAVPLWNQLGQRLNAKTRLVSVAHVSNVTGVIAPIEDWTRTAHEAGVPILIDASQSISHLPIDVRALDCDFLAFSSHKMFGPNGVGVLYVKRERFAKLGLANVGGGMVSFNFEDRFEPLEEPFCYEAGTPNVEGVIGLGAAIEHLQSIGMANVFAHTQELARQMMEGLRALPHALVLGSRERSRSPLATISMPLPSMRQTDLARLLADAHGILVSGGFHCAHVLHHRLKLEGTLRASAHIFNDAKDIDSLLRALRDLSP